jgi:sugar lactone lactonase YvrE
VAAADLKFSAPLKLSKDGADLKIDFTASAATDCAVSIVNTKGQVVRHLAAGVLGKNAPPPLRKDSLEQSLRWDGKDDYGAAATGGPFRVRVALGLKPQLDKFIGFSPAAIGSVRALATDAKGEVYVFHVFGALHPNDGTVSCSVFSREGRYLRTILPYPANLDDAKLKGVKRIELEPGVKAPFIYQAETRSLLPGAGDLPPQRAVVTKDGRVVFVGVQEGPMRYAQSGIAQVLAIHSDGSIPEDSVLGTVLSQHSGDRAASLALSPDEKTLYATDLKRRPQGGKTPAPAHAVFRFGWTDKEATPLIGTPTEAGNDAKHLSDPRSVAVDKDGNIYVADKNNNRVAVFKADGGFLGALAVAKPERVEVHSRTGAVYVLGGDKINELSKFASWKEAKAVAQAKLPAFSHERYTVVMALDASSDPPVLWFGTPFSYYARFRVLRIEDKGDAFGKQDDIAKLFEQPPSIGAVADISLDRQRNVLQIGARGEEVAGDWLYDVASGKVTHHSSKYRDSSGSFGLDGNFYSYSYPKFLHRYGPEHKPLPFAETADKDGRLVSPLDGTMRLRGRGVTADHQGNIFVLLQKGENENEVGDARDANLLYVYAPDGKLKQAKLVDSEIRSLNSVRLDPQGNIYLGLGLRPGKELLPPGLKGKVPEGKDDPSQVGGVNLYPLMYGSIVKFGPRGGVIRQGAGGVACNYAWGAATEVKGAEWLFSGASVMPSWRTKGTPDVCLCESPRFDVDGFGRSFFPDAGRCRMGVVDTAGNELAWFGKYGNQDSGGSGSAVPAPEIPLWWPQAVAVGDDAVYIGDRLNRRVVRVKLLYAAEETRDVP